MDRAASSAWHDEGVDDALNLPDDPRLALIAVDASSVLYMVNDTPRPVVLFQLARGIITGEQPNIGEMGSLSGDELERGAA